MIGLAHRGFEMEDYGRHVAGYLSDHGFETVLSGQQHEVDEGACDAAPYAVLGYDRSVEGDPETVDGAVDHSRSRQDLANAAAAADYIRSAPDDPFFLSLGLYNTHQPMPLEQERVDPDRVAVPGPLPDHPDVRREIAAYHVLAERVDDCVSRVIEALRETDQYEDTVVVFSTDHGVPFPHMKCDLFEGGTGIALIVRFPDTIAPASGTEDALVSNVDLVPTLCESVGVPVPEWVHGSSLLPLVRGEADTIRDAAYSEVTYHAAYEPKRCVRTERWTYIRRYDDGEGEPDWDRNAGPVPRIPSNTDHGPSKDVVEDAGLYDRSLPREALYDRTLDPVERDNLATDPEFRDVRDDLAGRLMDWMRRTDDPLLDGPVPKPDGAVADRRDAFNPREEPHEPVDAR
jgi:arylsulfatase A-like enzyme